DLSVVNVRANQIFVTGEVTQPGAYQISSLGTAMTALYAAGGVTERSDMRAVLVQRGGKTVATLDLYDYLLRGDTRNDVRLETGDVVFVPTYQTRAEVSGAVVRPGIYELKGSETLADLLHAAGGFRANAALKRLAVYRLLPEPSRAPGRPARAVVDVALAAASAGGAGDPMGGVVIPELGVIDGDSVVVDSVPSLDQQYYVAIAGMVNKPGLYPWREGMTLRELILLARGSKVGADLREAEIARLPTDRTHGELATTLRAPLASSALGRRAAAGTYVLPPGSGRDWWLESEGKNNVVANSQWVR